MIEAERLNIPIRLGDAPQNDTLNSIKKVMSRAVFEPEQVMQGAGLLVRNLKWKMLSSPRLHVA